LLYLTYKELRP